MNFKGTLIGALTFLIVLGVFYWDYSGKQKKEEQKVEAGRVVNLETAKIDSLTLKNEKGEVELKKEGDSGWNIVKPVNYPAATEAMTSLLTSLSSANKRNPFELAAGQSMADYGLESPPITLEAKAGGEGKMATVSLGEAGPGFGEFYAHVADKEKEVFLVGSSLKNALDKNLFDLRDKKILPSPKDGVTTLTLVRPLSEDVKAEKRDGGWSLLAPHQELASDTAIGDLLQTVDTKTIAEFIDTTGTLDLAKYGLEPAKLKMDVWGPELGGEKSLLVGYQVPEEKQYYAKRTDRDQVFVVPGEVFDGLMKPVNDLRAREVFPRFKTSFDVERMEIHSARGDVALVKDDKENWTFEGSTDAKVDNRRADDLATALVSLRVEEFLTDNPATSDTLAYGFDNPEFTAVLSRKEAPSERLVIGRFDTEQRAVFGQRGEAKTILRLGWADPDSFLKSMDDLRLRNLASVAVDQVGEIDAVQSVDGKPRSVHLMKENGAWKGRAGESEDRKNVSDLDVASFVNALNDLRYDKKYPPDSPDSELTLAPSDVATTLTLKQAGSAPLFDAVFTTPQFDVRFARQSDGVSYSIPEDAYQNFNKSIGRLFDAVPETTEEKQ